MRSSRIDGRFVFRFFVSDGDEFVGGTAATDRQVKIMLIDDGAG